MHFDHLVRRVPGLLVQSVDVLRDERVELSGAFEVRKRAMPCVRFGVPRRMIEPLLPRQLAHLGIRHVVMDVRTAFRPSDFWSRRPAGRGNRERLIRWKCRRPSGRRCAWKKTPRLRTRSIGSATSSVYTRPYEPISCRLIGSGWSRFCAPSRARHPFRSHTPASRALRETTRSTRSHVRSSKTCISGNPRGRPISASTSTTIGSTTTRAKAVDDSVASARQFRERVAAIDAASLSLERQLDREQLLRAIDSRLLTLETVRPWAVDPDSYSSGLTRTAYIMIKRNFAPPEERLRQADRPREGDAGGACRGQKKPRRTRRACTPRSPSSR